MGKLYIPRCPRGGPRLGVAALLAGVALLALVVLLAGVAGAALLAGTALLAAVHEVVLVTVYGHFSIKSTKHLLGICYTLKSNKKVLYGDSVVVRDRTT